MKRLFAVFSLMFFIFAIHLSSVTAFPLVISCHSFRNCAVYVDDLGPPRGDGLTSASPFRTITEAVNFIKKAPEANDYDTIYVRGGTYNDETFPWVFDGAIYKKSIIIRGGWNYDFSSDLPGLWPAIVNLKSASNALAVISANAMITGMEITGGGGFKAPMIINNTGSASYHVSIINNVFHDNFSKDVGALAVGVSGTNDAVVRNNTFYKNSTFGPVLYLDGNITLNNNLFYNNVAGSSLQCNSGSLMYNNFFLSETASHMAYLLGKCSFFNNTLARNVVNSGEDNGVVVINGLLNIANNNLIAYNSGGPAVLVLHASDASFQYNGFFANSSEVSVLGNNFVCDPKFPLALPADMVDPKSHKLGAGSTCIDRGTKIIAVTDDYFGTLRPMDGNGDGDAKYDPGAFEVPQVPLLVPVIGDLKAAPAVFFVAADASTFTKISFNINTSAKITVAVYDGAGGLINTLIDAKDNLVGPQSAAWNGAKSSGSVVSSGDYNIKITAINSSGSDTKQVKVTVNNTLGVITVPPPAPAPSPVHAPAPSPGPSTTLSPIVTIVSEANRCAGFIDIEITDILCPAIKYVKEKGIFSGYPDGSFRSKMIINRAETTKVILLGFGKTILNDDATKLGFSDVEVATWYMKYLRTAKNLAIVQGYLDGTFKPAQQVNRVEILKIFLKTSGKDLSAVVVKTAPYRDTSMDAAYQWYLKYVQYSKNYALVDATPDGYFYPAAGMSRGDVALLFYRYHEFGLDK